MGKRSNGRTETGRIVRVVGTAAAIGLSPSLSTAQAGCSGDDVEDHVYSLIQNSDGSWRVLLLDGTVLTIPSDQVVALSLRRNFVSCLKRSTRLKPQPIPSFAKQPLMRLSS